MSRVPFSSDDADDISSLTGGKISIDRVSGSDRIRLKVGTSGVEIIDGNVECKSALTCGVQGITFANGSTIDKAYTNGTGISVSSDNVISATSTPIKQIRIDHRRNLIYGTGLARVSYNSDGGQSGRNKNFLNTQGLEVGTLSITPRFIDSILRVTATVNFDVNSIQAMVGVFLNDEPNARAVSVTRNVYTGSTPSSICNLTCHYFVPTADTQPVGETTPQLLTFRYRVGGGHSGGDTITVNGDNSQRFNFDPDANTTGVSDEPKMTSSLVIEEFHEVP